MPHAPRRPRPRPNQESRAEGGHIDIYRYIYLYKIIYRHVIDIGYYRGFRGCVTVCVFRGTRYTHTHILPRDAPNDVPTTTDRRPTNNNATMPRRWQWRERITRTHTLKRPLGARQARLATATGTGIGMGTGSLQVQVRGTYRYATPVSLQANAQAQAQGTGPKKPKAKAKAKDERKRGVRCVGVGIIMQDDTKPNDL